MNKKARKPSQDLAAAKQGVLLLLICFIMAMQCLSFGHGGSASILQKSSISEPRGGIGNFFLDLTSLHGNVSTYLDQGLTIPSTSFVAGSTVYVKGEGWPAYANITLSFTQGVQGTPVVVATSVVQTDGVGSFTSSLRIGSLGPPGIWSVIAEYSPNDTSSSTFAVSVSGPGPPSISTPVWLATLLIVGVLIGYFWHRKRVDQAKYPNYYSST